MNKLEQTLAATILALILVVVFAVAGAAHFYTFRADARARIAELEKKIRDVEEAQLNVNSFFSRELSRTRSELWTLEKTTRGGKTDERNGNTENEKTGILRPENQERKREGNRGYIAPAKISGST